MPSAALGWADLVRIRNAGGPALMEAAATLLGLERRPNLQPKTHATDSTSSSVPAGNIAPPQESEHAAGERIAPMPQLTFWMPTELRSLEAAQRPVKRDQMLDPAAVLPAWVTRPAPARFTPLSSWRSLLPRLRHTLAVDQATRALDLPQIVAKLGRGELLQRLPRTRTRRWGSGVQIIEDHSRRLVPYWQDQALAGQQLACLFPGHAVVHAVVDDALLLPPQICRRGILEGGYVPPAPGGALVVLGDLGVLAREDQRTLAFWSTLGREVQQAGGRAVALVPFAPATAPDALAVHWVLIPWERTAVYLTAAARAAQVERLFQALAVTVRVEPGLLREVRRLLGLDAAAEAAFWQHAAVTSQSSVAATLDASALKARRADFEQLGVLREVLWRRLCAWRTNLPDAVFISEAAQLSEHSAQALLCPEERRLLVEFFEVLSRQLGTVDEPGGAAAWFLRLEQRARKQEEPIWDTHAVHRIWVALHADDAAAEPPPGLEPGGIDPGIDETERLIGLAQRGTLLWLEPTPSTRTMAGSPLGHMTTLNRWIGVRPGQKASARDPSFWADGTAPSWANAWDWDGYGAWVEFAIDGRDGQPVTQRLRWIEPGNFMMGSPADEPERSNEGPQHEVTIRDGFWLFDTACPQDLWEAVMGENPSQFNSPDRPVERVSWNDVHRFFETINRRIPGLALSLPSEARWEYACRAGTQTPFSVGAKGTPQQVNYKGGSPYADGPTGLERKETLPVKALAPNGWGLYQMHGNVHEWVEDAWHEDYRGAPTDGSVREATRSGADRVVRGGSWFNLARLCRCAFRYRSTPDYRDGPLGFRCARVQVREPGRSEAERAELARPGPRSGSGRGGTDPARAAGQDDAAPRLLRLDTAASATVELPDAPALEIRTDRETLVLQRCAKPAWASAIGRDRFGLWADICIEDSAGEPVIQRLRWIPPGRFLMGSPKDEPGRHDDEGPPYTVTIGQGFWLFDTPCTQGLWVALGLNNPSRFQDPARPVDLVSWDDIQQQFLPALNERLTGFILPSEAQWEYACRAGTQTALYTGSIEILGERNAPALDPIAWYGGNSGVDSDLENGWHSSGWTEQQYPSPRSGSHPVRRKRPNDWGLHDMLGNVCEWTQDVWQDGYDGAPADGSARETTASGADRVIRGGSWSDGARRCRCASRFWSTPDSHSSNLGFRCARVQV